jgi:hypothetical protein
LYTFSPIDILFAPVREVIFDAIFILFNFTVFGKLFPIGMVVDTNDNDKSALA